MQRVYDGFWLPAFIRQRYIHADTHWQTVTYRDGRPADPADPAAISARWPVLSPQQWQALLADLQASRIVPPTDYFSRMELALTQIGRQFQSPHHPLQQAAWTALPRYTGYAPEMIAFVLGALDLMPLDSLAKISQLELPGHVRSTFIALKDYGLKGRLRLFEPPTNPLRRLLSRSAQGSLPGNICHPEFVLGYAAGNVIGTAHLIALLGQVSALVGSSLSDQATRCPAVLVKNSRQEPIFAPLILSALEQIDPALVQGQAIMIWDYEDQALQETLIAKADLVLAAAADHTIQQIETVIARVQTSHHPIRFHPHGHKVSFTAISADYLTQNSLSGVPGDPGRLDVVSLLAAIDSIFWDQYGCLSSRVHFVEETPEHANANPYGQSLVEKIRLVNQFLPRGAIPLQGLHDRYEKYAALTGNGLVELCSNYADDFLVVIDRRPWNQAQFSSTINDCIERTIVVRPIRDLAEVYQQYLPWIPRQNLQTMSVAIDGPNLSGWSYRFWQFVEAIGALGVTAVRSVGRSPFPQLAYSWDGYLPIDLARTRPVGWYTSVEFEDNYQEILETYRHFIAKGAAL